MKRIISIAALCLGLPMVAQAQMGEIYIPGEDDAPAIADSGPQPQSALADCLLTPSAAICASVGAGEGGDVAFESATGEVTFETLVLDLNEKKVTVAKAPPPEPPKYDAPKPVTHGKVSLPSVAFTIAFDYNSDKVRHDQMHKIDSLVAALNDPALQGTSYAVIGHTDAVGSEVYNCDLSLRRSASVTRLLESYNIYVPLYPAGLGEYALKDTYYPDSAANRRVTFMRLPDHPGPVLQTLGSECRY